MEKCSKVQAVSPSVPTPLPGFRPLTPQEMAEFSAPTEEARVQINSVGSFTQGLSKGLAMVGIPSDLIFAAVKKAGVPLEGEAFFGQQHLRRLMTLPEDQFEITNPFVERVGEEVGATLPIFALTMGTTIKAGQSLLRTVPKVGATAILRDNIMKDLAQLGPSKLAGMELLLATASGAGAATANAAFPDSQTAEIIGQLVGAFGVSGSLAVLRSVRNREYLES